MQVRFYSELLFFLMIIDPSIFLSYNISDYKFFDSDIDSDRENQNKSGKNSSNSSGANSDQVVNSCKEPGYETTCSGHGTCIDGICLCDGLKSQDNTTESLYEYSGKYCEECPYCKGQRCTKLLPCVESILRNLPNNEHCRIYYKLVQSIHLDYNHKFCHVEDSNRCMVKFKYFHDQDSNILLDIEEDVECLNGRNYIVFGWCVFIVYMILLMMIFKIL